MKPAKLAFDHCAGDYAAYRPTYPDELLNILAERAGKGPRIAADVGAGTGIFTRQLAAAGWDVIAVEPSPTMIAHVLKDADEAVGRRIRRVCASAEAMALANASVTLVTVAQAFHWFNPPYALAEFARVVRPGGTIALCWNNRDGTKSAFVEAFESLAKQFNPAYEREFRQQDWQAWINKSGAFEYAGHHRPQHEWRLSQEGFVGFSRSASYIRNVLSREESSRFEATLRALMREHFSDGECVIPLTTETWIARRLGAPPGPAHIKLLSS